MPIMRQTGFHIAPGTENQVTINFINISELYFNTMWFLCTMRF
jgi:hypothetical protein